MNSIVYFYSYNGSNKFLAYKIAKDLDCPIEEIVPTVNSHWFMLMGINFGNEKLKTKIEDFDRVILCGPIWMGRLIVPLKNFINKNLPKIKELVFVTCCGSTFEGKDEKFGFNLVFNKVKSISGSKCIHCEAFPINMVLTEEQKKDSDADIKYRLNDENFKGEIVRLYDDFIVKMKK